MIRTLLKFHNLDSTLDLNDQLSGFFKRGIVMGGDVQTVPGQLAVDVTPFKLIGHDGMVVIETGDVARLQVPAGQTSVVVFKSQYVPNSDPEYGFEVLELSTYNSRLDKDYLAVFCTVTLNINASEVLTGDIDYDSRDVIDPVGRLNMRGVLSSAGLLPTQNNRAGDHYIVTSGLGDTPALFAWNGIDWVNLSDSLVVASLLAAHRSNLFSNEIHMTDEQAIAATGTYGTPGVEQIGVTINVGSSTFTLSEPIADNSLQTEKLVTFLTTGILPAPVSASTDYYVIRLSDTTFQIASTPQNAQNNVPIILSGSQSGTHQAVFEENKYVTSTDPRLPSQDGSDALIGYPENPIPSASNPFVTAAYVWADPTAKALTSTAGPVNLLGSDGPFYVGFGGAGTAKEYFRLYDASRPREYLDPAGSLPIQITGVFKDAGLTQALVPSSEPTVLNDNGFYTGPLYLTISAPLTTNARLIYGKKVQLDQIDRNAFSRVNINSAQTSQESLLKFEQISGRLFDDTVPQAEQNINLLIALKALLRYAVTTTAANLVVSNTEFKRLRQYPEYAAEFEQETDEIEIVPPGQAFTVNITASAVQTFDASILQPDTPFVAVITYDVPPAGLSNTKPGHIFIDGAGNRWRILNYNPANNNQILIYTGGRTVSNSPTPIAGQILQGNNPRQLELTHDHRVSFLEDFIPVLGVEPAQDEYEELPPGGSSVGAGSLFTLIGTNLLPGQGSGDGSGGRLAWKILPKVQNNRYEERVRLYGNWKSDQENYPNQAVGDVSQGVCGIEYTGRIQDLALYTEWLSGVPYDYRVFVDGVYQSQLFPTADLSETNLTASVTDSAGYAEYLEGRPKLAKVRLGLSLTADQIHTVRVEITGAGTRPFCLSGIGAVYSQTLRAEKGRTFFGTEYQDIDTEETVSNIVLDNRESTRKVVRYIDQDGIRQTAAIDQPYYSDANRTIPAAQTVFTLSGNLDLLFGSRVGDVLFLSDRSLSNLPAGNSVYRRIVAQGPGDRTIEAAPGFDTDYVEYAFRVPVSPDTGSVVVGAPYSRFDKEFTRLKLEDWTVGKDSDVGNLPLLSQESRTTTLADGTTAIRVQECTRVQEDIEGYVDALSLSQTSSEVQITAWCSRLDLVFCGNSGPCTVDVEIDGSYSYTLSLAGDGVERHTVFYDAQYRTHSVKIHNPSVQDAVVLGECIVHELADPEVVGNKLSEYYLLRNSNSKLYPEFAPVTQNAISNNGVKLFDPVTYGVRSYGALGINQNDQTNPYFGTSLQFQTANGGSASGFVFEFFGSGFELYLNSGTMTSTDSAMKVWLNGLPMNNVNFPSANIMSINDTGDGFRLESGFKRYVCTDLVFGYYKVTVSSFDNVSPQPVDLQAIGIHSLVGQTLKRNPEDTKSNLIHFDHSKDLRSFLSLESQQIGLLPGGEGEGETVEVEGSGEAEDLNPLPSFKAVVRDRFESAPSSPDSKVDATITTAQHNFANRLYRLGWYRTSLAVGSAGTTLAVQSSPQTFALSPGDVVYFQAQQVIRRITNISGANTFEIDQAVSGMAVSDTIFVSQAVRSKDLINLGDAAQQTRLRDIFPNTQIPRVIIDYKDSEAQGDAVADLTSTAKIAVSISNSGLQSDSGYPMSDTFAPPYTRPQVPNRIQDYPLLDNADKERLFCVFFANPALPTNEGAVNLLEYRVNLYDEDTLPNGGYLNSAFCYNDGTGMVNCSAPENVSGATEIELDFGFIPNLYPGTAESDLEVIVNGQVIPRFILGAVDASDLSFQEVTTTRIRFSQDLITGAPLTSIQIRRKRGVQDTNSLNTGRISWLSNIWVGTSADVQAGYANFSSLQDAVDFAQPGQQIRIRDNVQITENVVINKRVVIVGAGYDSFIDGTITCQADCDYSVFDKFRCEQFIFQAGADGNIISFCFFTTVPTDAGAGNLKQGVVI